MQSDYTLRGSSGTALIEPVDPIDRLFELEDLDTTARASIDRHNIRIRYMNRRMSEIEKQIQDRNGSCRVDHSADMQR
jgi:hypothetical protein